MSENPYPRKSDEIFATKKMLQNSIESLGQKIHANSIAIDGIGRRVDRLEQRIERLEVRCEEEFRKIEQRFQRLEIRLDRVEIKLTELSSAIHKLHALIEEQTARNVIVLDGYAAMYESHKEMNRRMKLIERNAS